MTTTYATNSAANSAVNYLHRNSAWQSSSISKLSSGSRIVKASDDAASLAVGTKLNADVTALKQAGVNASQASSLLQVADGALANISDTLQRMKALSAQANSDVLSDTERGYLDNEFQEMVGQIDFITTSTVFNGQAVVGGAFSATAASFQVGTAATDLVSVTIASADSATLGVTGNIGTQTAAQTASGQVDTAIATINAQRATLGAQMSRFEKIGENISTSMQNLDAARSVLMDVDVAAEMTKFSTNQVLTQASTAMLAQANQLPQNLMRLLQ